MTLYKSPVILTFLLILLCGTGCRRLVDSFSGDKILAQVGDNKLYLSDVGQIFTPGVSPEDSVKFLESYVDMWVRKQVKSRQAELLFPQSVPEIDRMVEEYRSSLLGFRLDSYVVENQLDTLVTQNQIEEYYEGNRSDFVMDRPIVKGRFFRLSDDFRQKARMRDLFRWDNDTKRQDFIDLCSKNEIDFIEWTEWTDFSELLSRLPSERDRSDERLLSGDGLQEFRKDGWWYFCIITDRRRPGDQMPLVRARAAIIQSILNGRKAEIIRSYEDSIYRSAVELKNITINVE